MSPRKAKEIEEKPEAEKPDEPGEERAPAPIKRRKKKEPAVAFNLADALGSDNVKQMGSMPLFVSSQLYELGTRRPLHFDQRQLEMTGAIFEAWFRQWGPDVPAGQALVFCYAITLGTAVAVDLIQANAKRKAEEKATHANGTAPAQKPAAPAGQPGDSVVTSAPATRTGATHLDGGTEGEGQDGPDQAVHQPGPAQSGGAESPRA